MTNYLILKRLALTVAEHRYPSPIACLRARLAAALMLFGFVVAASCQNSRLSDPHRAALSFAPEFLSQTQSDCREMSISTRLPNGDTVSVGKTTTINLATSSSGGAFYSDAACTVQITSVKIEAYVSRSKVFYYRDDSLGTAELTATPPENKKGWTAATLSATIH